MIERGLSVFVDHVGLGCDSKRSKGDRGAGLVCLHCPRSPPLALHQWREMLHSAIAQSATFHADPVQDAEPPYPHDTMPHCRAFLSIQRSVEL